MCSFHAMIFIWRKKIVTYFSTFNSFIIILFVYLFNLIFILPFLFVFLMRAEFRLLKAKPQCKGCGVLNLFFILLLQIEMCSLQFDQWQQHYQKLFRNFDKIPWKPFSMISFEAKMTKDHTILSEKFKLVQYEIFPKPQIYHESEHLKRC